MYALQQITPSSWIAKMKARQYTEKRFLSDFLYKHTSCILLWWNYSNPGTHRPQVWFSILSKSDYIVWFCFHHGGELGALIKFLYDGILQEFYHWRSNGPGVANGYKSDGRSTTQTWALPVWWDAKWPASCIQVVSALWNLETTNLTFNFRMPVTQRQGHRVKC